MSRILIILIAALLLAACGARPAAPVGELLPTPSAAGGDEWTIHFTYTGGIAGFNRTMDVSSNGEAVVTDVRTGKTATIQLSPQQIAQLHELAAKAVFKSEAKPGPCADCFVYTLEIDPGTGTPFSAQVDDTNLEASGLSALVDFLRTTVDQALKP